MHTAMDLRAALVASCLRGALPPVDLRAVCFVRAIAECVEWLVGRVRLCVGEAAVMEVGNKRARRIYLTGV